MRLELGDQGAQAGDADAEVAVAAAVLGWGGGGGGGDGVIGGGCLEGSAPRDKGSELGGGEQASKKKGGESNTRGDETRRARTWGRLPASAGSGLGSSMRWIISGPIHSHAPR